MSATGGPLGLLVLQPTPFCNVDCSYCYLEHRNVRSRMSADILRHAVSRVLQSDKVGKRLEIAWHGGEPLTVPLAWYERALRIIDELRPAEVEISYRFQTNGVLVDDEWAAFLSRADTGVGISIDGPAHLHDRHRRTRAGRGTHAAAMRGLGLLQDHNVPVHVICVLTRDSLDDADAMFDFFAGIGIVEIGFNVEEIEAANRTSSLSREGTEDAFRSFIRRFFRRVWSEGRIVSRELESALAALRSPTSIHDDQNTPFAIASVGWNGAISTFSPELLGAHSPRFPTFAIGHVASHALTDLVDTIAYRSMAREIAAGVEACAQSCSYYRWCGGGAPANKLFETGRFDATETLHCRLTRKIVLEEALVCVENFAEAKQFSTAAAVSAGVFAGG